MSTLISIAEHLYARHQQACPKVRGGVRCRCTGAFPKYVVKVGSGSGKYGTQRNRQRTFNTQREADAWLRERLRQKRAGELSPLDRTVGSYLDEYEDELQAGKAKARGGTPLKPGSVREYLKAIATLRNEIPDLLEQPVDLVTPMNVQAAVDRLAFNRASRTVEKNITPLRTVFGRLERLGVIGASPMPRVVVPKDPPRIEALDDVDPRAAYVTVQRLPPRDRAFLSTCLLAGMRPSEVQALRWRDVDFERGIVNVARGYSGGELSTPKTAAGIRRVVLLDALRQEFMSWRAWVVTQRQEAWLDPEALIFARESDPLTPVTVHTVTANARRNLTPEEYEIVKPRNSRHIWVSANVAGGVDLVESMRSTGHTSPKIHLDTYGRQIAGKSEAVRAAIGEQFGDRILGYEDAEAEAWDFYRSVLDEENWEDEIALNEYLSDVYARYEAHGDPLPDPLPIHVPKSAPDFRHHREQ